MRTIETNPKIRSKRIIRFSDKRFLMFVTLVVAAVMATAQPGVTSQPELLISLPGQTAMGAQWSPDGKTIAFTSDKYNGIWLANANGEKVEMLTADEAVGFGFSWSPDSKFILGRTAVTENHRRLNQVKIFDIQTASYEIIADKSRGIQGLPQWSNDGSEIVYVNKGKALVCSSPRLNKQESQQSKPIVYAVLDELYQLNPETNNTTKLADFEGRMIFNLSPSPDGEKVSFQLQGMGLYVMNTDGSGMQQIGFGEKASWMPEGRYAIVSVTQDDGHNITGADLYAVDVKSGEYTLLTGHIEMPTLNPAVSPDGKSVLFDNPDDGNIYRLRLE